MASDSSHRAVSVRSKRVRIAAFAVVGLSVGVLWTLTMLPREEWLAAACWGGSGLAVGIAVALAVGHHVSRLPKRGESPFRASNPVFRTVAFTLGLSLAAVTSVLHGPLPLASFAFLGGLLLGVSVWPPEALDESLKPDPRDQL